MQIESKFIYGFIYGSLIIMYSLFPPLMSMIKAATFLCMFGAPIASYRQSVEEELPTRQPVTTVSATDADQQDTPNSEIIYSITDILGFDTVCPIILLLSMVLNFTVHILCTTDRKCDEPLHN